MPYVGQACSLTGCQIIGLGGLQTRPTYALQRPYMGRFFYLFFMRLPGFLVTVLYVLVTIIYINHVSFCRLA